MLRVIKLLLLLILLFPTISYAGVLNLPTVTVMADNNLSLPVAEIARNYSSNNHIVVNTSFVPQVIQQEQIKEGAAADVVITAKETWIDELKLQGLIDIYSQIKVAGDRLVLIGSYDSQVVSMGAGRFPAFDIIKAIGGEQLFIIANPETLAEGAYSKEALRNLGVANDLEPYTIYIKRRPEIFSMVVQNNAFALCFASSIAERKDIRVIDVIPELAHKPIAYNAVVIAGDNMDAARQFLEYLKTEDAKKIFRKYGFTVDYRIN